jgi:hypothetical protein
MSFMQNKPAGQMPMMQGQMGNLQGQMGGLQGQMGSSRPEMDQLLSGISNMQNPSFAPPEKPGYDWGALLQRLGEVSNLFAQEGGAQPGYQPPQQRQEQPRMNMYQNPFDRNR